MPEEPIKIVIHLDGGLVRYVYGDHPLDVIILDTDVEETDERITIKDVDGDDLEVFDSTHKIDEYRDEDDKEATEHYFNEIKKFT